MSVMETPCILFRKDTETELECTTARELFKVYNCRAEIPDNSLVIGRYSVLPYYKELEQDLAFRGSTLINSYYAHKWIADFQYYDLLKEYTFHTVDYLDFHKTEDQGPFVVKGKTNSRKHQWSTHMFAKDRRAVSEVACNLANDALIGPQDLIVRKYEELVKLDEGLNGLPITNEWRFFICNDRIITYDFYWRSICDDDVIKKAVLDEVAVLSFVKRILLLIKEQPNRPLFYVLDVAQKVDGSWILVEVNDAQMSGLNGTDIGFFYTSLYLQCLFLEKNLTEPLVAVQQLTTV